MASHACRAIAGPLTRQPMVMHARMALLPLSWSRRACIACRSLLLNSRAPASLHATPTPTAACQRASHFPAARPSAPWQNRCSPLSGLSRQGMLCNYCLSHHRFPRIWQVCSQAAVHPSEVAYVEAHGTGTVAGDAQELMGIEGFYGLGGKRTPQNPLLIGSVKSNMGHCEGASGLAGKSPIWLAMCSPAPVPIWLVLESSSKQYVVCVQVC